MPKPPQAGSELGAAGSLVTLWLCPLAAWRSQCQRQATRDTDTLSTVEPRPLPPSRSAHTSQRLPENPQPVTFSSCFFTIFVDSLCIS